MIKIIKTTLWVAILSTVFSCAKQNVEQPKIETVNEVSIATLKSYMADLIKVKVDEISYNEKTEQFSIFGIDQINRQELTASYERSLK